jgi:hypothetical protein
VFRGAEVLIRDCSARRVILYLATITRSNACNETNLMHCLSSVYSVTIALHVSGLLVAHHQEITMYICNKWYVLYVLVDCQLARLEWDWLHNQVWMGLII